MEDLFLQASELPSTEQSAWIDACADATEQERANAQQMLRALRSGQGRLDAALGALRDEVRDAITSGGANAGRYVLLHRLGAGGCGEVFLGRQEEPVRRLVAVKVLRDALGSPLAAARFRAEQQLVASLDHPGIAGMLESGELGDGRPWFSMPFIAGSPISDHCRDQGLSVRARVQLIDAVCEAVEHAHRRGVIHRDLKPANIMVTLDDAGTAHPRIIDFGVAKSIDAAFADGAPRTLAGGAVGTPEYMPPEQAEGGLPDTRSDVFSLGVVLYELLADHLPRRSDALRASGRQGLATAIRAATVAPPSTVAPPERRRAIAGDLDAVCLRAIDADPQARYQSVAELHADLRRWLAGDPVLAARHSRWELAQRVARRNWRALALAAAIAASLVGATVWSLRAARIEQELRAVADRRADQNARVLAYMSRILAGADPTANEGRADVPVREKLDEAVKDLDGGTLASAPAEEAEIRASIGDAYAGLGRREESDAQYRRALEVLARAQPSQPALASRIGVKLAIGISTAHAAGAIAVAEQALAAARQVPDDAALLGSALSALSDAYRMDAKEIDRAVELAIEAVTLLRPAVGDARAELGAALNNLGLAYMDKGDFEKGRQALEEAIAINSALGAAGGYKAMYDLHNLAGVERAAKRYEDAEKHARQALELLERLAGTTHPHRATLLFNLALIKRDTKDSASAETFTREGLAVLEARGEGANSDAAIGRLNLSSILRDQRKFDDAVVEAGKAMQILDALEGQDPWLRAAARMAQGRALTAVRRYSEAQAPLLQAWALIEPLGIDPRRRSSALLAIYQLYRDWNKSDPAALPAATLDEWRDRVRTFDAEHPGVIPPEAY